jgi:hypothetical protein
VNVSKIKYDDTNEGMTQWILIFGLLGFQPRSKLVEGMMEARKSAQMAQPMKPKLEERAWNPVNSTVVQGQGHTRVYPGLPPRRVKTYVLLV